MKIEELKQLSVLHQKLEKKAKALFEYIKRNHKNVLHYDDDFVECVVDEDEVVIRSTDLGYDVYEINDLRIPFEDFCSNMKKWADDYAERLRKEEEERKKAEQIRHEEYERQQYLRLKEKYDSVGGCTKSN